MACDYGKFEKLKKFTDSVGKVYGTEDFAVYLYSLVKMTKPKTVLELGTGLGTTALWIAQAMEENDRGTLFTVDDGSEWKDLKSLVNLLVSHYREDYTQYINDLVSHFSYQKQIRFINERVSSLNFSPNYDIVFSDFSHGPFFIVKLIADVLPLMEDNSYIFIDSASTLYPSYHTLESIVDHFNRGKVPRTVLELVPVEHHGKFYNKVLSSKFELTHIIENKDRNQNSTAQIKISPCDIMPQPRVNIRF